ILNQSINTKFPAASLFTSQQISNLITWRNKSYREQKEVGWAV
ncbi:hypothetical protein HMPREF3216_00201, partial [Gardnerella vaginalis]